MIRPSGVEIQRMEAAFEWLRELRDTDSGMALVTTLWALRSARGRSIKKLCAEKQWAPHTFFRKRATALETLAVDLSQSLVEVASLRTWLAARGVKTGFFFPDTGGIPDYLDPRHPRYAPKLAAAVHAWLAIENESAVRGKSPKQALARWLREQAVQFGLTDGDVSRSRTSSSRAPS